VGFVHIDSHLAKSNSTFIELGSLHGIQLWYARQKHNARKEVQNRRCFELERMHAKKTHIVWSIQHLLDPLDGTTLAQGAQKLVDQGYAQTLVLGLLGFSVVDGFAPSFVEGGAFPGQSVGCRSV